MLSVAQSLRLSRICIICNEYHLEQVALCKHCIKQLKLLPYSCQQCAHPLSDSQFPLCGTCIKKPPFYDQAYISHAFDEPIRSLIHQFKYQNGLYLTSFLSHLMLMSWNKMDQKPQCLIPIPMHPRKLRERGYNQSILLVKSLAKKTNIPYDTHSCKKIINTAAQASLSGTNRRQNLKKAFKCSTLAFKHVALVDDLLTTGATANELAYILKKKGTERVDIWCCARAIGS